MPGAVSKEVALAQASGPVPPLSPEALERLRKLWADHPSYPGLSRGQSTSHYSSSYRPAKLVSAVTPQYPFSQWLTNTKGRTTVSFVVGEDGSVLHARILDSTNSAFNGGALDAVMQWRFSPAMLDGRKVKQIFVLPVQFASRPAPSEAAKVEGEKP